MFMKKWNPFSKTEEIDESFWRYYEGRISFYKIKNDQHKLHYQHAYVKYLRKKDDPFSYKLVI